ncbi:DgyrCDS4583 [Dimorphilus gyrociliatus]|uniref:DgyrCDS4583 n=1 Tax=Dimorphilus gyrociliatus TaxID=2664684 RepID=A0A7I8VH29_9ANNE|nr:DgyrCDS4583 [Dimorphilus gyrociliatus]
MRGLTIVLAALFCGVACHPKPGSGGHHPPMSGSGEPHPPMSGSGGHHPPMFGSGGHHPPMSGSGEPHPPMSGSGEHHPPMFGSGGYQPPMSGSGKPYPPMSGSGEPHPPMSGSGDHPKEPMERCPALQNCYTIFASVDFTKKCHATADKMFECFSSQKPEDICSKGCKHLSILAMKSVGRSMAHLYCPARKDCPNVAEKLPSEEQMKRFFEDDSLCKNQKALKHLRYLRKTIENFEGDLIQCGITDMINVEIFDVLEVIAEARCDGCDFRPAAKGFSQVTPGRFCPMQKKINQQIDTIIQALSGDARCHKLTQNKHKMVALVDRTIGVWCNAENEYSNMCGHADMGSHSDRKRRSFAKNIFTRLFPVA